MELFQAAIHAVNTSYSIATEMNHEGYPDN